MVGHDVRRLAYRDRGLYLGVVGHTPIQGGAVDLDVVVSGVELVDQRFHADAVAAAQEVPPHDFDRLGIYQAEYGKNDGYAEAS